MLTFAIIALLAWGCGATDRAGFRQEPVSDAATSEPAPSHPQEEDRDAAAVQTKPQAGGASDSGVRETMAGRLAALHVEGNQIVDDRGHPLRLIGVNHSGSQYRCIGGYSVFDSPADDLLAESMAKWGINIVRLGINEDCWLQLNATDNRYSGIPYRRAIREFVDRIHRHGMYVILEVHWSAPGAFLATRQQPMLDADHGMDLWKSIATEMADDPGVLFDLYNEPYIDSTNASADAWACWRDGCEITRGNHIPGRWRSAGMQELVNTVRQTGAKQIILAAGLRYANDLGGFLAHMPDDPARALAASFHVYNFTSCNNRMCWEATVAPVHAQVPVIAAEIGEDDCNDAFISDYMHWADDKGMSYLAWTFNPVDCRGGPALVQNFLGEPTPFGLGFRNHVLSLGLRP